MGPLIFRLLLALETAQHSKNLLGQFSSQQARVRWNTSSVPFDPMVSLTSPTSATMYIQTWTQTYRDKNKKKIDKKQSQTLEPMGQEQMSNKSGNTALLHSELEARLGFKNNCSEERESENI